MPLPSCICALNFPIGDTAEALCRAARSPTTSRPRHRRVYQVVRENGSPTDLLATTALPPGSIVYTDPNDRVIPTRRNWTHEFQRPIYFLLTRDGYVCGWCELDEDSEWLTLIPHPLSPVPARRWKYRTEIETMGRVVAVDCSSGRMKSCRVDETPLMPESNLLQK